MNASIDQNNKNTWTAFNETTRQIEDCYCDPITGALLVFGVTPDGNALLSFARAAIDANNKGTAIGWNDTTNAVEALRCGTDGSLLVIAVS